MQTLNVALGDRAYPIHIGRGLLERADLILPQLKTKRVAIVTNDVVGPLYLERLRATLETAGMQVAVVSLPDGEAHKDLPTLNRIFDMLLAERCERSTTLIALGGGVVGDMGGFAAACYQRGMPFIQIPTTLLAQVDSSVGGKTAVNHALGKNMIGAFYQPRLVLADIDTLNTLPARELSAGLAEVIKYGLIRDLEFLQWLEQNLQRLLAREPRRSPTPSSAPAATRPRWWRPTKPSRASARCSILATPLVTPSRPAWVTVNGCMARRLPPAR